MVHRRSFNRKFRAPSARAPHEFAHPYIHRRSRRISAEPIARSAVYFQRLFAHNTETARSLIEPAAVFGWFATLCSSVSFVPQAWKVIRTRETRDISRWMYVITVAGFASWTAYGILLGQWPIIVTNSLCFALSAFILAMKLLPQREKEVVADALDPEGDGRGG
jgi:MtN3 and saliva related transmembrane protein